MQFLINGLISGSALALLAIALQAVYLPTRVLFIAQAGIYALAPYVAATVLTAEGSPLLAAIIAVLVCCAVSTLCEAINHGPLARKGTSELGHLITSLGIYIVLSQLIVMVWGSETHTLRTGLEKVTTLNGIVITGSQWFTAFASAASIAAFVLGLRRTDVGLRLRALAENPTRLALFGYNVERYRLLAFCLSGLFASGSALLTAVDVGYGPSSGLSVLLLALVAVVIGGRGTFAGPIVAALVLGILRSLLVWQFSPRWQDAITFGLLAVFLLFRPEGLLTQRARLEVSA